MSRLIKFLLIILLAASPLAAADGPVDFEQALVLEMQDEYELDPADYEIKILFNQLKTEQASPENLRLEAVSLKEPLGSFTMRVTVERDGKTVEKGQVRVMIKKFAEVLVTTGKIRRNEALTPDKLTLQRMDITSLQEQPVQSLQDIEGYRSKRNLSAGRIVTSSAVEPVPDIEVGREVSIVYNDGLCSIAAPGQVLQNGWEGDFIKVKNKTSGKIILARVIDDTSVAVDP
ncbi:MAG: flagellar basal body P-ring formation chaperone FlgA [Candidatus Zixiibacteriota bacterium]